MEPPFFFYIGKNTPPFYHVESIFCFSKQIHNSCLRKLKFEEFAYISLQKSKYKMFVLVVKCILVCVKISIVAAVVM